MTSPELDSLPLHKVQKMVADILVLSVKIVAFKPFEEKIVKFIFETKLESSDIIVSSQFDHANRGDLQCLKEGVWINDMVINCIVGKLTYQVKKKRPTGQQERWFLPTFVIQNGIDGNQDVRTNGNNFFRQHRYTGDIKPVKKIFCHINDNNAHWFCCLINMEVKEVHILYSMIQPATNKHREDMVKKYVLFFDGIMSWYYSKNYELGIKDFPIHRCMWVPHQTNSY